MALTLYVFPPASRIYFQFSSFFPKTDWRAILPWTIKAKWCIIRATENEAAEIAAADSPLELWDYFWISVHQHLLITSLSKCSLTSGREVKRWEVKSGRSPLLHLTIRISSCLFPSPEKLFSRQIKHVNAISVLLSISKNQ